MKPEYILKEEIKYKRQNRQVGSLARQRWREKKRDCTKKKRDYMIDYLPTSIKQSAVVSEWQIPPLKSSTVA